jgi:hypothetical protein
MFHLNAQGESMSFQPLFRRFHEAIQLKRFEENAELRSKRDIVLARMRERMTQSFDWFNQGSYAMGTGIKPLNRDYDIDIGIVFAIDPRAYDPCVVKGWAYEALKGHTDNVEWRRPCITVYYHQGGEPIYHVDLAILTKDAWSGALRLAIGKQHSSTDQRQWQPDDRKGFMAAVESRFSGDDAAQFRRVICYLKRWKDVYFAAEGRAAPTGLAFTVAAYQWFRPTMSGASYSQERDDLGATRSLAAALLQRFTPVWDTSSSRWFHRLALQFPREPSDDIFARTTNQQMQELYQRLEKLIGWLDEAQRTGSVAPLRRAFGDDFPER